MCGDHLVVGVVGAVNVGGLADWSTLVLLAVDHRCLLYATVQWVSVIKGGSHFWTAMCGDHAVVAGGECRKRRWPRRLGVRVARAVDPRWLVCAPVQWVSVIKGGSHFWTAMCGDHA